MLTYYEVLTTNLGLLTTAAAKWEAMAGELQKVETRYGDTVQKITMGDDWSGLSVQAARVKFTATRYEYSAAQSQAKAIASLLRGAHELLTDLRKKLESARDDAIAAGMTVSEQGRVAFDYSKLTASERSAYHHDPDGQEAVRTAVGKWQKHIDDRVKAASDADQHVHDALTTAVVDSNKDALGQGSGADETLTGFNNYAEGDLKKFEKPDDPEAATKTDSLGVSSTGPGQYGKEASVKAYADLFHETAKGEGHLAGMKLSGIADIYGGGRATANWGISDKGFVAKAEGSAGVRALAEGRAGGEYQSVYGRAEGFAGAEAGLSAKATREEVTVGAKAFAGAKGSLTGGVESGGIGVGLTAEGWAGPGAEAWWGYKKDEETGVWKLGGKAGASPLLGGSIGLEITVDPDKVAKTAGDVADAVGDTAHAVGDAAGDFKDWLLD
ncbi:hypothetical protein BCL76_102418 [Streptomyces sp. CG 926]|uniref:hypothetical protein n=1 Tax=Streptomyces sp. CG 926 TaxID=1882405 RepID=UPI000D6D8A8A|nr:hypothetical protein [Streptomyces sp. CG 926]PWK73393.1 hypothetical protein BCL76_102418 [Streptomyces sp. CG 926]